jgi:hypothetical protein
MCVCVRVYCLKQHTPNNPLRTQFRTHAHAFTHVPTHILHCAGGTQAHRQANPSMAAVAAAAPVGQQQGQLGAALGTLWAHSVNLRMVLERTGDRRFIKVVVASSRWLLLHQGGC